MSSVGARVARASAFASEQRKSPTAASSAITGSDSSLACTMKPYGRHSLAVAIALHGDGRGVSDTPTAAASAEALFERFELGADLGRQLVAELGQVGFHLRQLLLDEVEVDRQQLLHRLLGDLESLGVDLARG